MKKLIVAIFIVLMYPATQTIPIKCVEDTIMWL